MGIKSFVSNLFRPKVIIKEVEAYSPNRYYNLQSFDGEKTPYNLGNPYNIELDYHTLRLRAWELYLKTDFVQNAIRKYCLWVVGSGLKLQAEPKGQLLDISEKELKEFKDITESKFRLYAGSTTSSYTTNVGDSVHDYAVEALKNSLLAGDVLCVARFDGKRTNLQIIDGGCIGNPVGSNFYTEAKARGNRIYEGVELDKKGTHIAYYVRLDNFKWKRVLARGAKSGRVQAWLMYGLKGKLGDVRGMSLLTAVIETAAKMDRFKEATLGSAEENAKIAYTIEHGSKSDGENPMINQMVQSFGIGKGVAPETEGSDMSDIATKIAQTTEKQVFNMPIDSKLVKHEGGSDINFGEFWIPNIEIVYATLGIPPEVAQDKFGGAYSGSRAALKSWEFKMMVDRVITLQRQYYQPFYNYWLDLEILQNKIHATGYLIALKEKDYEILGAYRNTRFIGAGVPHIDPVKEVNAERIKLGDNMKTMPLTSTEQSMERLGTGDVEQVIKKVENEKEMAKELMADNSQPVVIPAN